MSLTLLEARILKGRINELNIHIQMYTEDRDKMKKQLMSECPHEMVVEDEGMPCGIVKRCTVCGRGEMVGS